MSPRLVIRLLFSAMCLVPDVALAYTPGAPIGIYTGVNTSIPQIIAGFVNVMLMWSTLVATAVFLYGAFRMVASGGSEDGKAAGKKAMKDSLIGLAIVLSAWMIVATFAYFISG